MAPEEDSADAVALSGPEDSAAGIWNASGSFDDTDIVHSQKESEDAENQPDESSDRDVGDAKGGAGRPDSGLAGNDNEWGVAGGPSDAAAESGFDAVEVEEGGSAGDAAAGPKPADEWQFKIEMEGKDAAGGGGFEGIDVEEVHDTSKASLTDPDGGEIEPPVESTYQKIVWDPVRDTEEGAGGYALWAFSMR